MDSEVFKQIVFLSVTGRGIATAAEEAVSANAAIVFFMYVPFVSVKVPLNTRDVHELVFKVILNESQTIIVSWLVNQL